MSNPYPHLTRTFGVRVSANLTFPDAHAALLATDALAAMFPEDAQVSIDVYTNTIGILPASDSAAQQQNVAATASPTPAPKPAARVRKPAAAPSPSSNSDESPASSTLDAIAPGAIEGEPAAVAGETIAAEDQPDVGTDTTQVPTDDELRAAVAAKMKAAPGNRALIATLLGQAGVQAVTHVPEGARPAFLAAVNAL